MSEETDRQVSRQMGRKAIKLTYELGREQRGERQPAYIPDIHCAEICSASHNVHNHNESLTNRVFYCVV